MSLPHEVAMALRRAYFTLHRQSDACLAPLGMTANQFVILSLLAERDGVTQSDLAGRAASDANTLRALLVVLERKGLIERRHDARDARARCVTISARGRRMYASLWSRSDALRKRLQSVLRPDEAEQLLSLLSRITSALEPPSHGTRAVPARGPARTSFRTTITGNERRRPARKPLHV